MTTAILTLVPMIRIYYSDTSWIFPVAIVVLVIAGVLWVLSRIRDSRDKDARRHAASRGMTLARSSKITQRTSLRQSARTLTQLRTLARMHGQRCSIPQPHRSGSRRSRPIIPSSLHE